MDFNWKCVLILWVAIGHAAAESLFHVSHFIQVVERIEDENPELAPLDVVKVLRKSAELDSPFIKRHLGGLDDYKAVLNPTVSKYLSAVLHHKVTETGVEKGVVLTSDGTTVALAPVLLGIEAGLSSVNEGRVAGLYRLALGKTFGLSFLHHSRSSTGTPRFGPDGCWDSVTSPKVFTLSGTASLATDAQVNGGMDGVNLGIRVSYRRHRPAKLSTLLKQYYNYRLGSKGLDSAPSLISVRRRQNFSLKRSSLQRQVLVSLGLHQRLTKDKTLKMPREPMLIRIIEEGLKDFEQKYIVCPNIIPRCQWGAEPYRGTPTILSLPLSYLFIHHTHSPGKPCLTFEECSRDMRSMQRFHQEDRGWDDIGYSFVAGSDGNIYEGRGWQWQGAHTLGQNSKGYGVSFIGDYMETLPSRRTLDLVSQQLASCATNGGRLKSDYIVHGHRQVVNTSCPGDALYAEVKTWAHYKEVQS